MTQFRKRQVVRVERLSQGVRILTEEKYLEARQEGRKGEVEVVTFHPDLDEDEPLVWVRHGQTIAPYYGYELTIIGQPCD